MKNTVGKSFGNISPSLLRVLQRGKSYGLGDIVFRPMSQDLNCNEGALRLPLIRDRWIDR